MIDSGLPPLTLSRLAKAKRADKMVEFVKQALASKTTFEFRVLPCPAPRMTRADAWKNRPCVLRYRRFRDDLRLGAKKIGYTLQPILNITFILPMPESWSAKKRLAMNGTPHQQRPDRDNLLKAFQDTFEGDDGFVWDGRTTKLWGEVGKIIVEGT